MGDRSSVVESSVESEVFEDIVELVNVGILLGTTVVRNQV